MRKLSSHFSYQVNSINAAITNSSFYRRPPTSLIDFVISLNEFSSLATLSGRGSVMMRSRETRMPRTRRIATKCVMMVPFHSRAASNLIENSIRRQTDRIAVIASRCRSDWTYYSRDRCVLSAVVCRGRSAGNDDSWRYASIAGGGRVACPTVRMIRNHEC
jgi:hypothetical protein